MAIFLILQKCLVYYYYYYMFMSVIIFSGRKNTTILYFSIFSSRNVNEACILKGLKVKNSSGFQKLLENK